MNLARPWLAPDLTLPERIEAAEVWIVAAGWRIRRWSLRFGWAPPPLRTVYLPDGLSGISLLSALSHEAEHVRRSEAAGRYGWTLRYIGGPVALGAALLAPWAALAVVGAWVALAVCLAALIAALLAWGPSEAFRRAEEVEGFAAGYAARDAVPGGSVTAGLPQTLHGYAVPYLVGGSQRAVQRDVLDRADEIAGGE